MTRWEKARRFRSAGLVLAAALGLWLVAKMQLVGSGAAPRMLAAALLVVGVLMLIFELREAAVERPPTG